jgi:hypothetical protein
MVAYPEPIPFDATTKVACLRHSPVPSPIVAVCVIPNQLALCGTDDGFSIVGRTSGLALGLGPWTAFA